MTVLVVGDAGVVEGEIWYLRLDGILCVWGNESMPDMVSSGRMICNGSISQGGLCECMPRW